MSMSQSYLLMAQGIASVSASLSEEQINLLVDKLGCGDLPLSTTALYVKQLLHFSTSESRIVARLLLHCHNHSLSQETLIIALLSAQHTRKKVIVDIPSVKLVWTGPISLPGSTQSTENTLLNMIDKGTQEIVIVGYVLTEAASTVIEHLALAQKRGVQIVWIGNLMEEKISVLRACWPTTQRLPNLYTRRASTSDPFSALHAKIVIVDQRSLLVTSANLSYHGLRGNIEIGVEVEGKIALDASTLLNRLITENVCVKVSKDEM